MKYHIIDQALELVVQERIDKEELGHLRLELYVRNTLRASNMACSAFLRVAVSCAEEKVHEGYKLSSLSRDNVDQKQQRHTDWCVRQVFCLAISSKGQHVSSV